MIPYLLFNAAIDGYLVWAAGRLVGHTPPPWRTALAAVIGAAGALWQSGLVRLSLPLLMLGLAYGADLSRLSRVLLAFLGATFLLAGLSFGFLAMLGLRASPDKSFWVVPVALPISAVLLQRHLGRRTAVWAEHRIPLRVRVGQREATIMAFADSGNQLRDPWTHWPVVVAEYRALKPLWPPEVGRIFASGDAEAVSLLAENPDWSRRFCLVPFRSLGSGTRFLLGFRPDGVVLGDGDDVVERREVVIGVSRDPLSSTGNFGALMPAGLWPAAS